MIKFYQMLEKELSKQSKREIKFQTMKMPEIDTKENQPIQAGLNRNQSMYENVHKKQDWNICIGNQQSSHIETDEEENNL